MTAQTLRRDIRTAQATTLPKHLRLATTESAGAAIRRQMDVARATATTAVTEFVADLDRITATANDLSEVGAALPPGVIELLKKAAAEAQGLSGNIQQIMARQDGRR